MLPLRAGSLPEGPRQTFRVFAAIGWLGERQRVEPDPAVGGRAGTISHKNRGPSQLALRK